MTTGGAYLISKGLRLMERIYYTEGVHTNLWIFDLCAELCCARLVGYGLSLLKELIREACAE